MNKMTFDLFKNIIIEQNKELLKKVSKITGKDEQMLLDKYIKPDYYLPIIIKSMDKTEKLDKSDKDTQNCEKK